MKRLRHFLLSIKSGAFVALVSIGCAAELKSEDSDKALTLFRDSIEPLLKEHCFECHSHEADKSKGGLMVDSAGALKTGGNSGAVFEPGNPDESLLFRAVSYLEEDMEMPPKTRLSEKQVADIRLWIELGAPDPRVHEYTDKKPPEPNDLWSLRSVKNPDAPEVNDTTWPRTDVDRFVLARLEQAELKPLGGTTARQLIRRLHCDLTGLPPTPEAMTQWLARFEKSQATAATELADKLLATPQFGERWARHWLDTARYAESNGNNRNRMFRYAWRYRNWVIDSYNEDQPYDAFLKHQLAGDLMPADSPDARKQQRIATGFLAIGPKPYFPTIVPLDPDEPDRARYDWAAEQIDATMSGMMGLTVGCARCHDHKTDPIPTRDYYALAGIFRSTEPPFGMWHHLFGVDEGQAQRDFLYDWNLLVLNDELLDDIVPLQEKYQPLVMEENQILLHQRHWPEQIKRMEDKLSKREKLPADEIANMEKSIAERRAKLAEEAKRLAVVQQQKAELRKSFAYQIDQAMGVEDAELVADVHLRIGGEHAKPGALVPRGFPSAVQFDGAPVSIDPTQSGRLELAEWIAHPNHPLTARVAVNRIWYHLFGSGLVTTLDTRHERDLQLNGLLNAHELAFRMQTALPDLLQVETESRATLDAYGVGKAPTDEFARQCLAARRMAEAGVRFIELTHTTWDHHSAQAELLPQRCREIDQPIAALLNDLAERGLLKDTLVLWGGEFGRTFTAAHANGGSGHNNKGYTMWMAGGGTKPGFAHGQTDDDGWEAIDGRVHTHDLHATLLHLLGLDHERLTHRYAGRDFRLTDVKGNVVNEILT